MDNLGHTWTGTTKAPGIGVSVDLASKNLLAVPLFEPSPGSVLLRRTAVCCSRGSTVHHATQI